MTEPTHQHWRYVFDEHGGYDCTSSAFRIYDENQLVATIDVVPFITNSDDLESWEARHARHPAAESYAKAIVDAMNHQVTA